MYKMQEESKRYLKEAARHLQIADHMTYVTFPIVNEKKLIIKIFEEIFKSIQNSINSAIYYEFENKNLILNTNQEKNINNFMENIAKTYDFTEKEINNNEEEFLRGQMINFRATLPWGVRNYICTAEDYCRIFKSAFLRKFPGSKPINSNVVRLKLAFTKIVGV